MIGQFCTCDVENFGDILYPVIFRKLAAKHGLKGNTMALGFLPGQAPCAGRYAIQGAKDFIRSPSKGMTDLIVGGGDILREDANALAGHYYEKYKQRVGRHPRIKLLELVIGQRRVRRRLAGRFKQEEMSYAPAGPFILNRAHYPHLRKIMYYSCGAPFAFTAKSTEALRDAFESASFLHVRDQQSKDKLRRAGVTRDIDVSPDMILTLSDFFVKREERTRGRSLLAQSSVVGGKKIICVQSSPQSRRRESELLQQLISLKKRTDAQIVLLPLGYCHGDERFLKKLAAKSGGLLNYAGIRSVYDAVAVIAASELFVGTSLHGNITALSFGIPHLFGPIAVDKAEGFLKVVGLDEGFKLESWSELNSKVNTLARLPSDFFTVKSEAAKRAVHGTFRRLARLLRPS